jgi:hypothetical protein
MVRLLLRTSERAEQWQREVDDYRNDEVLSFICSPLILL